MSEFIDLQCGLTNDHIVEQPIGLLCGHYICENCVPDQSKIKCKICSGETEKYNLKTNKESCHLKEIIESCLSKLFDFLEQRTTDGINSFRSILENKEYSIDSQIKYIAEEIEIRIQSVKDNLDELFEKFKVDLVRIKKEIIEVQNEALNEIIDPKELENNFNQLRDYIKNNQSKTQEKFYQYQENLKNLNKLILCFQDPFYNSKVDLKLSEDQVDKKLIGEILFEKSAKSRFLKMKKTLLKGIYESIEVASGGKSLISLPNGNLVFGTQTSLMILDENFKIMKSVALESIECCALNHRNEIYVSGGHDKVINLLDLNLKKVKVFRTEASDGLCCNGDFLYTCDQYNKRIEIQTLDFDYVSTIRLDDWPYTIQTSETTIAVSCSFAILFYDMKTRNFKYKYKYSTYLNNIMNYIDSIFCSSNFGTLIFFDSDGNFIEKMMINKDVKEKNLGSPCCGFLCRFKDNLYMTNWNSCKILKFLNFETNS